MNTEDWDREAAFIRLEFPPAQRDTAQAVAVLFAQFVGRPIVRLRPDHTIGEIFGWARLVSIDAVELAMALEEELACKIDYEFAEHFEQRTFRELVEHISRTAHTTCR
jgi:hypothetical protein